MARLSPFAPSFLLFAGCVLDSDLGDDKATGDGDAGAEAILEDAGVKLTVDGSFHTSSWGSAVPNCRLDISFVRIEDDADAQVGTDGTVTTLAEEPGTCAITHYDPGEAIEAKEWDPPGYLEAGSEIALSDEFGRIVLPRVDNADGTFVYSLADCTEETYPFGRLLDLELPSGVGSISASTLPNSVAVPPDFRLVSPTTVLVVDGGFAHFADEPLVLAWTEVTEDAGDGSVYDASTNVWLRNSARDLDNQIIEAVHCLPADGVSGVEVPVDILAQITPLDPADTEKYSLAGQVDLRADARDVEVDWASEARMSTYSQMSGAIDLYAE